MPRGLGAAVSGKPGQRLEAPRKLGAGEVRQAGHQRVASVVSQERRRLRPRWHSPADRGRAPLLRPVGSWVHRLPTSVFGVYGVRVGRKTNRAGNDSSTHQQQNRYIKAWLVPTVEYLLPSNDRSSRQPHTTKRHLTNVMWKGRSHRGASVHREGHCILRVVPLLSQRAPHASLAAGTR